MDASKLIDQKIASLTDWRGEKMKAFRKLVHEVDPRIVEEWKWMGTPVWNSDGIVCCANAHNSVVKVTFLKGAFLKDPQRIFNAELEGNARRAIKWSQGDAINVDGVKRLVRDAIALNREKPAARKPDAKTSVTGKLPAASKGMARKPAAKAAAKQPAAAKKTAAKQSVAAKVATKKPAAKKPATAKKAAAKKPTAKKK
jgi:hypothetical protein